jgi:hypothetical protein
MFKQNFIERWIRSDDGIEAVRLNNRSPARLPPTAPHFTELSPTLHTKVTGDRHPLPLIKPETIEMKGNMMTRQLQSTQPASSPSLASNTLAPSGVKVTMSGSAPASDVASRLRAVSKIQFPQSSLCHEESHHSCGHRRIT